MSNHTKYEELAMEELEKDKIAEKISRMKGLLEEKEKAKRNLNSIIERIADLESQPLDQIILPPRY